MNKASGGDGIPVELFQTLKYDAIEVLYSICQQIWKTQLWPQDWKRSVFFPIPKKDNAKNAQTATQLHTSHTLVMFKIAQASLQQYMKLELADVQAGFRRGKGTRNQIVNNRWIIETARGFQKNMYFRFTDSAKAFDCVDHNKLWKILRHGSTRPPYLSPEKSVYWSRSNSWNQTWNNRLVPNWERTMSRLYFVTLLI